MQDWGVIDTKYSFAAVAVPSDSIDTPLPLIDVTYVTTVTDVNNLDIYSFSSASIGSTADGRMTIAVPFAPGGAANSSISGVTMNGSPMTAQVRATGGTENNNVGIFTLFVSSGTTANFQVTYNSTQQRSGLHIYRAVAVSTGTTYDTASVGTSSLGSSVAISTTIDVPAGGAAIAAGVMNGAGPTLTLSGLATVDVSTSIENANNLYAASHEIFYANQTSKSITLDSGGVLVNSALAVIALSGR